MKLLWVSNAPFTDTGYGVATKAVTRCLVKDGHTPIVLAYWGLQGCQMEIDGVMSISPRTDLMGNDCTADYARHYGCDFALIHRDIWVNALGIGEKIPLAAWFPIDHDPISPDIVTRLKETRWAGTMSRHGVEECAKAGFEVSYLPHSVDIGTFNYGRHPEYRPELFGNEDARVPEDAFLISMVAANKGFPPRKGWPEMYMAIAEIQRRYPNVYTYSHTLITTEQGGPDLQLLASRSGCDMDRMRFLNPLDFHLGVPAEQLARFYQASDVLLNTSYGEGFGIPILEAQACGTPVIVTDCSSMTELCWNGQMVGGTPMYTPHYAWWKVPHTNLIIDALDAEIQLKGQRHKVAHGQRIAQIIANDWSDEVSYERWWQPFLARIQKDLELMTPQPEPLVQTVG